MQSGRNGPIPRRGGTPEPSGAGVPGPVGRDQELARLRAAIGDARPVVVAGEAGIGKTTLLAAAVAGRPARTGGALRLLAAMPGLALRRAVGPLPDGDVAVIAREVARRVPGDGVLVLDDLHWADDTTLAVVVRLAGRVRMLAGVRTGGAEADEALAGLAAAGFELLLVGPLGEAEAAAVALRQRPAIGPAAARRLAALGGGNPLHIEELARDDGASSLRLALAHRVRGMLPGDRRLVELLAVAGTVLEPAALHALGDTDEVDRAIARAADAGLVTRAGTSIEIRHALIAEVVAAAMTPARRRRVHRLAATLVDDDVLRARHLAAVGDRAGASRVALAASGRPGTSAGERASLLALGAEHASGPGAARLRLDAAERLADAALFREAERLVGLAAPRSAVERARADAIRARARWAAGDPEGSLAAAEAALARTGPGTAGLRPALLLERAWTVTLMRAGPRAVALAEEALAAHGAAGLLPGRAQRVLATALSTTQEPIAGWGDLLRAALEEARAAGDPAEESLCAKILAASELVAGDPAEGRRLAVDAAHRARDAGLAGWEQSLRSTVLTIDAAQGAGERVVTDGDALLAEPLEPRLGGQVAGTIALALVDLGRLEAADALVSRSLATAPDDPDGRFDLLHARVELALAGGDPAGALGHADAALARHGGAAYGDVRSLRVARDWAALELGHPPGPPVPDDRCHPFWAGAAPEREAIRALAGNRPEAAVASFAEAAERYRRYLRRAEIRCRWGMGGALRRAGRAAEAVVVLEEAEAAADALALAPLAVRIRRSLRLVGVRRSVARGRSGRLSVREREVLDLVAAGLTNEQIAGRLGVGRPTVVRLIANASLRLGAGSRLQAALESRREPA